MMEKAEESFTGKGNFHFIKTNVESIPLDDNFFDIVMCINSVHHFLNPDKALKELYRLLKEGGKIFIIDPTADKLTVKVFDKVIKFFKHEHVKIYSTKEIQQLFNKNGLKYISSEDIGDNDKIHIAEKI